MTTVDSSESEREPESMPVADPGPGTSDGGDRIDEVGTIDGGDRMVGDGMGAPAPKKKAAKKAAAKKPAAKKAAKKAAAKK